jgi:hypothetical protein
MSRLLAVAALALLAACPAQQVKVEPVKIEPIHITVDVNLRDSNVDKPAR